MFQNVIMPEVTVSETRGLWGLLDMIGNPKSQAAANFLKEVSAEKDAAVERANAAMEAVSKSEANRAEVERLAAVAKSHRDEVEGRLSKAEADLRKRIDAHAKAAAKLQEREDDLRVKQTAHASAVAAHQKEVEAAKISHEVREAALAERERSVADAHLDIERRKEEFQKHMAPVLAAAALAR